MQNYIKSYNSPPFHTLKKNKTMDIFCASQSPSLVSLTMVDGSSPSSSSSSSTTTTSIQLDGSLGDGGRAIDRYNPIIRDSSRISKSLPPSPQPESLLVSPKPHIKNNNTNSPIKKKPGIKKQSNLKPNDEKLKSKDIVDDKVDDNNKKIAAGKYISPPAADSTRHLLSDPLASMDRKNYLSENMDPAMEFVPEGDDKYSSGSFKMNGNDTAAKSPSASRSPDQVVVLRVSLHCKGCERKMRKHLSKMRGVTSFTIDFAAKKVTVVGDVTPLEVIASISKVKTIAQISTHSASMLSASSSPSPLLPVN
ncbi:hypothetical protein Leryth_008727 [Lithospermum erythrorhizon]|nr:hypothetical protein Leryth_008727 [Lithospermum erythrorhizon]